LLRVHNPIAKVMLRKKGSIPKQSIVAYLQDTLHWMVMLVLVLLITLRFLTAVGGSVDSVWS